MTFHDPNKGPGRVKAAAGTAKGGLALRRLGPDTPSIRSAEDAPRLQRPLSRPSDRSAYPGVWARQSGATLDTTFARQRVRQITA
jgi:hypothetical protein